MKVEPGDKMYAYIKYISGSTWQLYINDTNASEHDTPWEYNISSDYPNRTSADWEEESGLSGYLPLSNFRAAYFGPEYTKISNTDYANINSTVRPVGKYQNVYSFINSSLGVAYPSNFTDGGTSFIVYEGPQLALNGNLYAKPNAINLNQNATLTGINATGGSGTGNYIYQWLEATSGSSNFAKASPACDTSTNNALTYTFCLGAAGNDVFRLKVALTNPEEINRFGL